MRFPHSFVRYVGTVPPGGTELGDARDAKPTSGSPGPVPRDNYFSIKTTTAAGYYLNGFQLVYNGPTASMTVSLWAYESQTLQWVQFGDDVTLTPGELTSVPFPMPTELGGIDLLVLPTDAGTETNGAHVFAVSGMHTS